MKCQGDDPGSSAGCLKQRSPAMRSEMNFNPPEEHALVIQGRSQPCDRLANACAKGGAMIPKHPEVLCEL